VVQLPDGRRRWCPDRLRVFGGGTFCEGSGFIEQSSDQRQDAAAVGIIFGRRLSSREEIGDERAASSEAARAMGPILSIPARRSILRGTFGADVGQREVTSASIIADMARTGGGARSGGAK